MSFEEYKVTSLLPLLSGPLLLRMVEPIRVSSMDQIDLFKNYLYLIGIIESYN